MVLVVAFLCIAFDMDPKGTLETVNLMQLINGTNNYYTRTMLTPVEAEAAWTIKRYRMLAGEMTAEERALYVSSNKAPIFIVGVMKGAFETLALMCKLSQLFLIID